MSMQEFFNEVKSSNSKNSFYLASGANIVRLVSQPIKIEEAFCIAKAKDKETGEEKVIKRSEIVYPNCGYQKYASAKFVAYAVDSADQKNEDGTPKIKTLQFGWKVLEGIVNKEKSRELQGLGVFTFPMSIDCIISKDGQGQTGTTYSVDTMITEAGNKVLFTAKELEDALAKEPSLREWKEALIKETQERHAKFGTPKAEKQIKEEADALKKGDAIATINIDADIAGDDTVDYPADDINPEDIPF